MTKFFDDPHHHLKVAITKEGQAMAGAEVAQVSIATGRSDAQVNGQAFRKAFRPSANREANCQELATMPADDGYLLKGTYNDYLSQVVPESLKKTLLGAAIQILELSEPNNRATRVNRERLGELISLKSSFPVDYSRPNFLPGVMESLLRSYTGKIIFISVVPIQGSGRTEIQLASIYGEVLAVFGDQPSDFVEEKLRGQLKKITNSTVLVIAEDVPEGLGLALFELLTFSSNQVVLQQKNPFDAATFQHPILEPQEGRSWVKVYWYTRTFTMSSRDFPRESIIFLVSMYQKVVRDCCESSSHLNRAHDTPFTSQLLSLCINLLFLDPPALDNQTHMFDKLFQVVEFLAQGVEYPSIKDISNEELQSMIGNHFPKKMRHCLKCRACKKNNKLRGRKNENCRKSKYVCEGCSDYYQQKVHLCVECFKKFHAKIAFFMNDKTRNGVKSSAMNHRRPRKLTKKSSTEPSFEVKLQAPDPSERDDQPTEIFSSPRQINIILQRSE